MNSSHTFERTNDYLYMTVTGTYRLQDFKSYVKIIRDKCEEEQTFKILMDALDVAGIDIPTIERYYMGIEVAEQLKYKIKLAIVWHKEFINHFGETVAVNRGGNIGVFSNMEAAMKWLLYGIKE
jgi:hypothetical protein